MPSLAALAWFLVGPLLIVVLTELQKRFWARGYFSSGDLIVGFDEADRPGWAAIGVKGLIAVVGGALGSVGFVGDRPLVGALAAGFGGFIVTWPVLLGRGEGVPPNLQDRLLELRLISGAFVLSYVVLGWAGGVVTLLSEPLATLDWAPAASMMATLVVEFARQLLVAIVVGIVLLWLQRRGSRKVRREAQEQWSPREQGVDWPDEG